MCVDCVVVVAVFVICFSHQSLAFYCFFFLLLQTIHYLLLLFTLHCFQSKTLHHDEWQRMEKTWKKKQIQAYKDESRHYTNT